MPPNPCASSARIRASSMPACATPSRRAASFSTRSTKPRSAHAFPASMRLGKRSSAPNAGGCSRPRWASWADRSKIMSKLQLSVAVGNYDRVRPLIDGAVQIDGVDPVFMNLPPEEIFFRAFRSQDFDICELSLSSFTVKTAERSCPYVGLPAFVSRAFRHNSIYVRRDRIKSPADLKGKRVGLPEYQLTACVWARIILEDDHGVKPSDIVWVRGGIEHPGRPEKIAIKLSADVRMEDAPQGATISELLERGET